MTYLDSCVLIYAVEDDGPRGAHVRQRLADASEQTFVISPLVKMECLVGPLRNDDLALHDHYLEAFAQFGSVDIAAGQYLRAAELRARHRLSAPDALHLATAQANHCDELWTNDARLQTVSRGLAVDVMSDP
ncbi:type II toxin-antitoxin system VapC family toxin [Subtercola lobariae]|uniref:type II toxin-antitoxin system VapC family toxin n=1 Tax=Subtercola lobariae TaxID=1588641 RepID=UPI0016642408|nr:type II toxin-antitoxin system VapC family toxin [Subtercola lobariae]